MGDEIQGGFILLARKYKYTDIYRKKPLYFRCVWEHILLSVNYADNTPMEGYKRAEGLFCFNDCRAYLSQVTQDQFNRAFAYLREENMITCERRGPSVKVCVQKYDEYQSSQNYISSEINTSQKKPTSEPITPSTEPKKQTWLSPLNDVWKKYMGCDMRFGQAAKALAPLYNKHNSDLIIKHFGNYLAHHQKDNTLRMVSLERFASTFAAWTATETKDRTELRPNYNDPTDPLLGRAK